METESLDEEAQEGPKVLGKQDVDPPPGLGCEEGNVNLLKMVDGGDLGGMSTTTKRKLEEDPRKTREGFFKHWTGGESQNRAHGDYDPKRATRLWVGKGCNRCENRCLESRDQTPELCALPFGGRNVVSDEKKGWPGKRDDGRRSGDEGVMKVNVVGETEDETSGQERGDQGREEARSALGCKGEVGKERALHDQGEEQTRGLEVSRSCGRSGGRRYGGKP